MASDLQANFSPSGPSFFTIILEETLRNNKIPIPKKIARKFGATLKSQVVLKLPCGSQWELGVTKSSDGKMWIDNGWAEFSKHYSLAYGHFLVFRYEGNSQFHVVIFDTTTTEIDYPNSNLNHSDIKSKEFSKEETHEEYALPFSQPHKRMRTSLVMRNSAQSHQFLPWLKRKVTWRPSLALMSISEASEAASKFFSTNPYFPVVLQQSYVERGPLNIPPAFARTYFERIEANQTATLKVGERCWSVSLLVRPRKCSLSRGWALFAKENALSVGDVCIFELIKRIDEVVMKVSIFRQAR